MIGKESYCELLLYTLNSLAQIFISDEGEMVENQQDKLLIKVNTSRRALIEITGADKRLLKPSEATTFANLNNNAQRFVICVSTSIARIPRSVNIRTSHPPLCRLSIRLRVLGLCFLPRRVLADTDSQLLPKSCQVKPLMLLWGEQACQATNQVTD